VRTPKTIKQILEEGTSFLEAKGKENARSEAEKLIAFGLGLPRVDIYLNFDKPLAENELEVLRGHFKERVAGKPLQHIIGEVQFRYLKLKVNEHVLIPRPETELIIDLALKAIKPDDRVLELGTGSGCIALSIAKEAKLQLDAAEISEEALQIAKENARINNVEGVNWLKSSWFEKVNKKYDVIIANPPYVSLQEYNNLPVEITKYEPKGAVTDEADGLKCLKEIIFEAPKYLKEKGSLLLEIGFDQEENVAELLKKAGFKKISFKKDLAGKTRFAVGQFPDKLAELGE